MNKRTLVTVERLGCSLGELGGREYNLMPIAKFIDLSADSIVTTSL